ncbi:MAG TPA: twin-arginine translocation signal domain-containing protein [Chitinophagaceae bacterium]|nr:twin-arginine translocation signal domain-containing protein [Chitinophagaceae bacterium]
MQKKINTSTDQSRRKFLKTSALGGIAVTALSTMAFAKKTVLDFDAVAVLPAGLDEITI